MKHVNNTFIDVDFFLVDLKLCIKLKCIFADLFNIDERTSNYVDKDS